MISQKWEKSLWQKVEIMRLIWNKLILWDSHYDKNVWDFEIDEKV